MPGSECRVAHYSGHVQGVGFRFTVLDIAEAFPSVTGTVRNLPDGRVEIVAEGPREALEAFLRAVAERMRGYISRAAITEEPATGQFQSFTIRH